MSLKNYDVLSPTFWSDNDADPNADWVGPGPLAHVTLQSIFGVNLRPAAYKHDRRWDDAALMATSAEKWNAFDGSASEFKADVKKLMMAGGEFDQIVSDEISFMYYRLVSCEAARFIFAAETGASLI